MQIMTKYTGPRAVLAAHKPGSNESWFNGRGEINAGSRPEVIQAFASMMAEVASGKLQFTNPDVMETASKLTPAQEREMFTAAYYDHKSSDWAEIGSSISTVLYETAEREGFLRRYCERGDLSQGMWPRINVRFQNVTMLVQTGPSVVAPIVTSQKYIQPPEFYVSGNVRVEERDIAQGSSDLLDDTYARALENIFVKEDRVYVNMLDKTIGLANQQYLMSGGMQPSNLAAARTPIITWGLSAEHLLIAADFWTDIAGNASAFGNLFDPVTQYELVQTGFLGTLLGMKITTDGFRDPNQRVVKANQGYILSSAINHAAFTDRGPVNSKPIDTYPEGIPARGWFFWELLSLAIVNPRSVVAFTRV